MPKSKNKKKFSYKFWTFHYAPLTTAILKMRSRRKICNIFMKFKFKHVFNTYRMLIKVKFSLLEIYMEISEHSKKIFFGKKNCNFFPTLSKHILVCKIGRDLKISLKCRHILVLVQLVSILPSFYLFLRFLNKCKNVPFCPIFHYAPPPPPISHF